MIDLVSSALLHQLLAVVCMCTVYKFMKGKLQYSLATCKSPWHSFLRWYSVKYFRNNWRGQTNLSQISYQQHVRDYKLDPDPRQIWFTTMHQLQVVRTALGCPKRVGKIRSLKRAPVFHCQLGPLRERKQAHPRRPRPWPACQRCEGVRGLVREVLGPGFGDWWIIFPSNNSMERWQANWTGETSKILETSKLPQVLAFLLHSDSSYLKLQPLVPSMHLGGGMRGKAWCWLKFTLGLKGRWFRYLLEHGTAEQLQYSTMSLWVSKFMQCSLQHWSSQHQEVCTWHLQKKRTMFQCFSMRQRRRHLHLHGLHALPRHWSTGSHRVGRWNFGTTFGRAVLCHNGPSASNIIQNQEGPADLMSFNAFFYFCTEFELFPKHAPGSPAVHGGSWSWSKMGKFWEIPRWQTAEWFELKQSSTRLTLPFFFLFHGMCPTKH